MVTFAEAPLSPRCKDGCVYEFGSEWCAAFDTPCIDAKQSFTEAEGLHLNPSLDMP
jgi:hypothetical protein